MQRILLSLFLAFTVAFAGCHKKPEKPKSAKRQREESIQRGSEAQAALNAFVAALREVLLWYQTQPTGSPEERRQTVKALAEKMAKVPVEGLPDDVAEAWEPMLEAWRALAKTPEPDAALNARGAKAAEALNSRLSARGVVGIRF